MGQLAGGLHKFVEKTRHEGLSRAMAQSRKVIADHHGARRFCRDNPDRIAFVDVLFINGCDYCVPHPIRYRVDHQVQQLEAAGLTVGRVDAWNLDRSMAGDARSFVIFRCPWTPEVGEFIALAKSLHKKVYFDIDDLVIDRKYTDTIPYLATMPADERARYDDGVDRMGRTLRECGSAITTTEALARELSTIVPEVFINRNVASEEMLHFSDRALLERDVLPSLRREQVTEEQAQHWEWAKSRQAERDAGGIAIGYFSGSITHSADFDLVAPALKRLMDERSQTSLLIVGDLELPPSIAAYKERVRRIPFCAWGDLPQLISDVDINIAPLEDSIFNEAKSENKWLEAALVKVPTVASNLGAFAQMIDNDQTGILCTTGDEWYEALLDLVDHPERRDRIGGAAYEWCRENATTLSSGHGLATYLRDNEAPNVCFELPGLNISGGVLVALKHAGILQDAGKDVTLIDNSLKSSEPWLTYEGHLFPVRFIKSEKNKDMKCLMRGHIDQGVATFWDTLDPLLNYPNVGRICYLVQGHEPDFYDVSTPLRIPASATYGHEGVEFLTVSKWCQGWLAEKYGQDARYVPNGIESKSFSLCDRDFSGKIRILIEGDSSSAYKNVDEAFRIVDKLDLSKYEIWYMSYNAEPKSMYHVDRFLHQVPHEEVADVYRQCHILLKTSVLESFSYPPLEMMATGGYVVVLPNEGNSEYIRDGENCLTYDAGDLDAAVACIARISTDESLRERLRQGGTKTVEEHDWSNLKDRVLALYK